MIIWIVPITPVISKNFQMIQMTGTIKVSSFHMIVSITSKARDAGSSAMSLGETIAFLRMFRKQAKHDFYLESKPYALLSAFSLDFAVSRSQKSYMKTYSSITLRT